MLPQSSLHVVTSYAPSPPAASSVAWLPSKGNWFPSRIRISLQPSPLAAHSSGKAKSGERENVGLLHRENVGLDQNTAKGLFQNIAERLCDTTGCVDEYEVKVTSEPHHHASRSTKKLSERLISALPSQLACHSQKDVGLYFK